MAGNGRPRRCRASTVVATLPTATISSGLTIAISAIRCGAQAAISADVGVRFRGGLHRTALVRKQSRRGGAGSDGLAARLNPNRMRSDCRRRPERSPVKGTPVRSAPFIPGASPTNIIFAGTEPHPWTMQRRLATSALHRRQFAATGGILSTSFASLTLPLPSCSDILTSQSSFLAL